MYISIYSEDSILQEVFKVNQVQHLYVEDSEFGGAWHSTVDYFAVQYGHLVNNRLHTAGQWCLYVKGGSAYLKIEANELSNCQLGFQAGQSANLAMMRSPWLHYEAYDIKFVNNVLHHLPGVGLSVAGGYNILLAYNTLYRVGTDPGNGYPLFQTIQGERNCMPTDELPNPAPTCTTLTSQGGWGPNIQAVSQRAIPNRHVYIYNNIAYNPVPVQTLYTHLGIYGPVARPTSFQNLPTSITTDDDLVIAGNILWNGPVDHPLGVGGADEGCQPSNPGCNATQLVFSNTINTLEPELVAPELGYFQPITGSNIFSVPTYPIPDFSWSDLPTSPVVPMGNLTNTITWDRARNERSSSDPAGTYLEPIHLTIFSLYLPLVRKN